MPETTHSCKKKPSVTDIQGVDRERINAVAAGRRDDDIAPFEQIGKPLVRALNKITKEWAQ